MIFGFGGMVFKITPRRSKIEKGLKGLHLINRGEFQWFTPNVYIDDVGKWSIRIPATLVRICLMARMFESCHRRKFFFVC
jgi:hypothetical protein